MDINETELARFESVKSLKIHCSHIVSAVEVQRHNLESPAFRSCNRIIVSSLFFVILFLVLEFSESFRVVSCLLGVLIDLGSLLYILQVFVISS